VSSHLRVRRTFARGHHFAVRRDLDVLDVGAGDFADHLDEWADAVAVSAGPRHHRRGLQDVGARASGGQRVAEVDRGGGGFSDPRIERSGTYRGYCS
jgi:hypothetical protein